MPTLSDAVTLAAAGWAVLPLNGKVPTTPHGVKDATTDPYELARLWGRGERNIGARVPIRSVVIDIDPQNGGSLKALEDAAGCTLPETLVVHSGRGNGSQHRYYVRPEGPLSSRRLPSGIDVKTDSGYCVMPPSLHPVTGNPYRWEARPQAVLPLAVIELLRPEARRAHAQPAPADDDKLSQRALYLARHVEQLPEGNRNAGLYWAACRAVEDSHPESTFELLEGAALVAGLTEREAVRTIASARRHGGRA